MDKVYLVGVDTQNDRQFERSMAELAELANACEMEVVGNCVQHTQIDVYKRQRLSWCSCKHGNEI